jgi:hypothetical protein
MASELGKIEKPAVSEFAGGRKLFFVPLIFSGRDVPPEYIGKYDKYWDQAESQVGSLELKLGLVHHVYHELIAAGDGEGLKMLGTLNDRSQQLVRNRLDKGADLVAVEDGELLAEFMDWSRCLATSPQNQKVFTEIYTHYVTAAQKRNEHIQKQIVETLKENQTGLLVMREGHHLQFSPDIRVFYVAPPALDDLRRWLRDQEAAGASATECECGNEHDDHECTCGHDHGEPLGEKGRENQDSGPHIKKG